MDNKDLLLAIDNGTQSLKALIFDLEGRLLVKELVPFTPYFSDKPAWAEQDPDVFWEALCRGCQGLWLQNNNYRERIAGVAITTQRGTVINVDENGKPLIVDRFDLAGKIGEVNRRKVRPWVILDLL